MHDGDLQFHCAQTRCRLAREQSTTNDYDGLLQVRHLAQGQRVTNCPEVNHIAKTDAGNRWSDRAAAHGEAGFVEFNAFAVREHSQTPVDVKLGHNRAESRLDFVRLVPVFIRFLQFFKLGVLFAQKILRENPALVGRKYLRADERDAPAFIVASNSFAGAGPANSTADYEIVALNHFPKIAR